MVLLCYEVNNVYKNPMVHLTGGNARNLEDHICRPQPSKVSSHLCKRIFLDLEIFRTFVPVLTG